MHGLEVFKQKEFSMAYFDDKQKKLILSWHNLSKSTDDNYMAFISEWIAFNAICYNLYCEKAVMDRANIDRSKSKLNKLQEILSTVTKLSAKATEIRMKNKHRWDIDIHFPDRLYLSITQKYTEDRIFDIFVENYSNWYHSEMPEQNALFENLKKSLSKDSDGVNRIFVINMARIKDYSPKTNIDDLSRQRIVILCETNDLQTIKDVLYQIRCNIFHGEKIPGDRNDDRIVKSSLPILRYLVNKLITDNKIENNE